MGLLLDEQAERTWSNGPIHVDGAFKMRFITLVQKEFWSKSNCIISCAPEQKEVCRWWVSSLTTAVVDAQIAEAYQLTLISPLIFRFKMYIEIYGT